MGLKSFLKDSGERLFAIDAVKAAQVKARATQADVDSLSKAAGAAIANYIETQGLTVESLDVQFDAPNATVTVSGEVPDKDTRDKVLRCCGAVAGVKQVHDMLIFKALETDSQRIRGVASRPDESRSTAFPAAIAAGLTAMCLSDGFGWNAYPPLVFLIIFVATMSVILFGVFRDAIKHTEQTKTPHMDVDLGKLS